MRNTAPGVSRGNESVYVLRGVPAGFGPGSGVVCVGELGDGDRILELRAQSVRDAG